MLVLVLNVFLLLVTLREENTVQAGDAKGYFNKFFMLMSEI